MQDSFTAIEPTPKPRSRVKAWAGLFRSWVKAVLRQTEQPTPAEYLEIVERLELTQEKLVSTEVLLAVTKAERDAALESVKQLGLVVARDNARIQAEIAGYEAKKEKNSNTASTERKFRAEGD